MLRFLLIFFIALYPILLKAQNAGVFIKDALFYISNNKLIYTKGGLSNKGGEVHVHGHLKIEGDLINQPVFSPTSSQKKQGTILLAHKDDSSYGQLILNEKAQVKGNIKIEYPKERIKIHSNNNLALINIAFNKELNPDDLINNLFGENTKFYYLSPFSSPIDSQISEKSSLFYLKDNKWNPVNILKGAFKTGVYILNLGLYRKEGKSLVDKNGRITLSGPPVAKPLKLSFLASSKKKSSLDISLSSNNSSLVEKNASFLVLANPFPSNIDLRKIKGIEQVDEITISSKLSNHTYTTSFLEGIPTGDLQALYLKPGEFAFIKVKDPNKSLDLEINDQAKTFHYEDPHSLKVKNPNKPSDLEINDQEKTFRHKNLNSLKVKDPDKPLDLEKEPNYYLKENQASYQKLCMELDEKIRRYIFVWEPSSSFKEDIAIKELNKNDTNFWILGDHSLEKRPKLHTNILNEKEKKTPIDLIFYRGLEEKKDKLSLKVLDKETCKANDFYLKDNKTSILYKLIPGEKYTIELLEKGSYLKDRYQIYYTKSNKKDFYLHKKNSFSIPSKEENIQEKQDNTKEKEDFPQISLDENGLIIRFHTSKIQRYVSISLFNELNQKLYEENNISANKVYKRSLFFKGRILVRIHSLGEKEINKWIFNK